MYCHATVSREGYFWRGLFGCHFPRRGMQLNDGGSHRACIPMLPACVPWNPLDCRTHDWIRVAVIGYLAPHFLNHRAPQPKTSSEKPRRKSIPGTCFCKESFFWFTPQGPIVGLTLVPRSWECSWCCAIIFSHSVFG